DWDNDIICGSLWDLTRQTEYADACFGLTYFYSYPMTWKKRTLRLDTTDLTEVAGNYVLFAYHLTQDWNPGYHKTSTAYVDDALLYVTRPLYSHTVYLPMAIR
ncbi:MAG: hypothetical protein P1S60_12875, partial [Anaerolineae bacterium]|nr:hypothetical protein [Anaerolineae bacterium]